MPQLFFFYQAEESLEPMGSSSPRPDGLRRSVRWEKGPPDLFLFPPHPIFRITKRRPEPSGFRSRLRLGRLVARGPPDHTRSRLRLGRLAACAPPERARPIFRMWYMKRPRNLVISRVRGLFLCNKKSMFFKGLLGFLWVPKG